MSKKKVCDGCRWKEDADYPQIFGDTRCLHPGFNSMRVDFIETQPTEATVPDLRVGFKPRASHRVPEQFYASDIVECNGFEEVES